MRLLGKIADRLERALRHRALTAAVVAGAAAVAGAAGLIFDSTVLGAAGLAIAMTLVPATLAWLLVGGEEDEDDSGGRGGGPPRPPDPPTLPPAPGQDWTDFDEARKSWERMPV